MIKTITGTGLTISLDSSQIFPDDPGQGTPALVFNHSGYDATFNCAIGEGELTNLYGATVALNSNQIAFLEGKIEEVDAFLDDNS